MNSVTTDFNSKAAEKIDLEAAALNLSFGTGKIESVCCTCCIQTPDSSGHIQEDHLSAICLRNQEILKEMLAIYEAIENYTLCGMEYETALKHLAELDNEKERNNNLLKSGRRSDF